MKELLATIAFVSGLIGCLAIAAWTTILCFDPTPVGVFMTLLAFPVVMGGTFYLYWQASVAILDMTRG
jgi:hypothetical protein